MMNLQVKMVQYRFFPMLSFPRHAGMRICTLLITLSFFTGLPLTVMGEEMNGPEITIKVGVRDDARPFSYIDTTSESESILPGYSGYSIEVCRHVFKEMQALPQYRNYRFIAEKISASSRFKQLGVAGKLFMLCGPDSISKERLLNFRSSHAVFLTGMTYAYINQRSSKFPRGNYCEHVIGVVRTTTADTEGLADLANRDLLMRFDKALDLEVKKKSGRVEKSLIALQNITQGALDDAQKEITKLIEHSVRIELEALNAKGNIDTDAEDKNRERRLLLISHSAKIKNALADVELAHWDNVLTDLQDEGIGLAAKIMDLFEKEYENINAQIAWEIITNECPQGFKSMPVRKYVNHKKGISAFCKGEVLYYLADFDILKNKTQEIADCDIVMNRFARSREVYGVYFPKNDTFDTEPGSNSESIVNVGRFYADFNHFLLLAMQGETSVLEELFEEEFEGQQKSEELERFFDGFKFYTP